MGGGQPVDLAARRALRGQAYAEPARPRRSPRPRAGSRPRAGCPSWRRPSGSPRSSARSPPGWARPGGARPPAAARCRPGTGAVTPTTPSSSSPGIGLPYGDSVGEFSRSTSRRSTSSEITCSQRQASSCTFSQSSPITSISSRSASRCLRITRIARDATLLGELQVPVALHVDQVVPLHPGDGLRHGRATLMQPLGDPGPEGDDALLLELVDRPQVHLRGVDQVAHVLSSLTLVDHVRVAAVLAGEPAGRSQGKIRRWLFCEPGVVVGPTRLPARRQPGTAGGDRRGRGRAAALRPGPGAARLGGRRPARPGCWPPCTRWTPTCRTPAVPGSACVRGRPADRGAAGRAGACGAGTVHVSADFAPVRAAPGRARSQQALARARHRAPPDRVPVRGGARHADQRLRRTVPGVQPVPPGLAGPRRARPGARRTRQCGRLAEGRRPGHR